jgi:outer membrane protein assembly factor BamD (BamD/ComL family)
MDAQQTQPTQPSDSFYSFMAWLEVNKRKVMIWAAAALAVVVVAIIVISYQTQKERRASEALSNVRAPSSSASGSVPAAGAAEAYLRVAKDHSGTQAGARALLLAATAKFQDGAYADAQKYYEQFTREYPESRWLPQAYFGVASSLDAQGKTADATKQFEELRRRYPNDPVMDETKLALARLYENQNRPADAFKLYDDLVKANQFSGLGSEAGLRQAELLEKHPELAKTNLPPAMSPTPMMSFTNLMPQATNRTATNRIQIRPQTNTTQRPTSSQTQVVNIPLNLPTTNSAASAKP